MADIGEVDITLNGKNVTLRSTLRAARLVNSLGGFTEVFRRLATFDLETYITVVAAGTGKKPTDVEDDVFENGLPQLTPDLSKYVELLSNGGKPINTKKKDGDAATGEA